MQAQIEPPDEIDWVRLVWHPSEYDNGALTTSALQRRDMKRDAETPDAHYSIDREDKFNDDIARNRARDQQARRTEGREEALLFKANCGRARALTDTENQQPFEIAPDPRDDNPAHCAMRNVTSRHNPSYINQLRALLYPLMQLWRTLALDEREPDLEPGPAEANKA